MTVHVSKDIPLELANLIGRCYKEKPDKKDLMELRQFLNNNPELYRAVFDITETTRNNIIEAISDIKPVNLALTTNIKIIREQMGYMQSPVIEKMLIDQVINTWLRCQWAELKFTSITQSQHSMREGEYLLQTLEAAQRRYLHTLEVLVRVRKINRSTMQINIAENGSQQVNIAGDLNKR